jgi:hypothetical protein
MMNGNEKRFFFFAKSYTYIDSVHPKPRGFRPRERTGTGAELIWNGMERAGTWRELEWGKDRDEGG